jgi:hypothetical protein
VPPLPAKKPEPTVPVALPVSSSRTHTPPTKRPGNFTPLLTQPAVPIQVAHGPICPTFEFKSDALVWLRLQDEYGDLIRRAAKEKDDKNISALLVKEGAFIVAYSSQNEVGSGPSRTLLTSFTMFFHESTKRFPLQQHRL